MGIDYLFQYSQSFNQLHVAPTYIIGALQIKLVIRHRSF